MITNEQWKILLQKESLSEFLLARSYTEAEGHGVFVTANGYYGTIFRIFPAPYVGGETENKISSFLTLDFPPGTVISFFLYTSSNMKYLFDHYKNLHSAIFNKEKMPKVQHPEAVQFLVNKRYEWLEKKTGESIFKNIGLEYYLRDFVNLVTIMVPTKDKKGKEISKNDLLNLFSKAKGGLRDFSPINFSDTDYKTLMREMLNPVNSVNIAPADSKNFLNYQITDASQCTSIEDDGSVVFYEAQKAESQIKSDKRSIFDKIFNKKRVGKDETKPQKNRKYAKVLINKMFPDYLEISEVSDLVLDWFSMKPEPPIPIPFAINLTIKISEREEVVDKIKDDAKWNLWQLNHAGSAAKFFPTLKDRADEASMILDAIDRFGQIPMKAMWSMILFSDDLTKLNRYASSVKSEFRGVNWELSEERLISLPVLLYSLPLQYDEVFYKWSYRFNTLFSANCAALAPMYTDPRGYGGPMITYIGRNGQLQGIDLFDKKATSYNFITIAPSGQGKSFLNGSLLANYLSAGAKIRVIDSGGSYEKFCNMVGGQMIRFEKDSNLCLNFFTDIAIDEKGEILSEEIESITDIIGMMANIDLVPKGNEAEEDLLKSKLRSYVKQAVKNAFDMAGHDAGMYEVGEALKNIYSIQKDSYGDIHGKDIDTKLRDLITSLYSYINPRGEHFNIFNGTKNIDFSNDFTVLELSDLEFKPNLRSVVLMTLTHIINNEFYFTPGRMKILLVDEAWSLLEHPIVGKYISNFYRVVRKFIGSIGVIVQSIDDFYKNDSVKVIYENAFWKFLLAQDQDALENAISNKRIFLDEFNLRLLKSLRTEKGVYSEIMTRTQKGIYSTGRFIVSRPEYWIYTSDGDENRLLRNIRDKYNIELYQAAIALGMAEENNTTVEEEIIKIVDMEKMAIKELEKELEAAN